ncbi:hypothetical protein BT63DRAFT_435886 [Microthyrium microscopicum]|uniref:Uncharacterized protein n=1 Tax=Microthyrium microscopicum TaxID=703497 RepID=A0A6A6URJ6_9PEZI|nr:hypothetical protein BT63DRAFT_435886 [Microthyrium microscopicum]
MEERHQRQPASSKQGTPIELNIMSFASSYPSVPFCDPSLPHHASSHVCSGLPHRACRQPRTYELGSSPKTPVSGAKPNQRWTHRKQASHAQTRNFTIQNPPTLQEPPSVKAPPSSPLAGRSRTVTFSSNNPSTSSVRLNQQLVRDVLTKRYTQEASTNAGADSNPSGAFAESPVLGYNHFNRHHRNYSAPVSRFAYASSSQQTARLAQPVTTPKSTRPRAISFSPTDKPLPSSPASSPGSSPPEAKPSTLHHTRPRRAKPPPPTAPLRLFPMSSPPAAAERSPSVTAPLSSPTTSYRPSVHMAARISSVFEDDDEKLGLLDYLKWPLSERRRRRRSSGQGWKRLVSVMNDDE